MDRCGCSRESRLRLLSPEFPQIRSPRPSAVPWFLVRVAPAQEWLLIIRDFKMVCKTSDWHAEERGEEPRGVERLGN